jgi:hypothetical protein
VSIFDLVPFEPVKPEDVLPNKPDSYGVTAKGETSQGKVYGIRNTARVNEHVARMFIKYNMDAEAAVSKMLPDDASEAHIRMLAKTLAQRPQVARYLQEILAKLGLTADAQKLAVAMVWEVAFDKKSKHWPAAMKLLADLGGWVKKTDDSDKPVTLVLKGFEKDLEELFDGNVPSADALPKKRPAIIEKTEEDNDVVQ